MEPADLLGDDSVAMAVLERVLAAVDHGADIEVRTTKSQVALRRDRAFAWLWRPGQYLPRSSVPVVLTIALGRLDPSSRWKEVAHPADRHWIHHLEVSDPHQIDTEVEAWLREAAARAGGKPRAVRAGGKPRAVRAGREPRAVRAGREPRAVRARPGQKATDTGG